MPTTHLDLLDRNVEQTNVWLRDVSEACGVANRREAYRILRVPPHLA